jgi:hypothetical protein
LAARPFPFADPPIVAGDTAPYHFVAPFVPIALAPTDLLCESLGLDLGLAMNDLLIIVCG